MRILLAVFMLLLATQAEAKKWDAGDWADYRREQAAYAKKHHKTVRHRVVQKVYQRPSQAQPDYVARLPQWQLPLDFLFKPEPQYMVDDYLCQVYQRLPQKIDSAGDFTWKDPAAAARLHMSLCDYAIRGMHPDLRESLYAMGRVLDANGVNWSFLSAFRDNYRQKIAVGFKASACGSWHGGSCRTKGYGDGRAADLWVASGSVSHLFRVIDQVGHKFGLVRPMPDNDPAHVQAGWNWNKVAHNLRRQRYAELGIELPAQPSHRVDTAAKERQKTHFAKRVKKVRIAHRRRHVAEEDDD